MFYFLFLICRFFFVFLPLSLLTNFSNVFFKLSMMNTLCHFTALKIKSYLYAGSFVNEYTQHLLENSFFDDNYSTVCSVNVQNVWPNDSVVKWVYVRASGSVVRYKSLWCRPTDTKLLLSSFFFPRRRMTRGIFLTFITRFVITYLLMRTKSLWTTLN